MKRQNLAGINLVSLYRLKTSLCHISVFIAVLSFKRAKCCIKASCESYLVSTPVVCPSPLWEGWVSNLKRSRMLVGKFEFNTPRWPIWAWLELYLTQDTTWNGNDSVLLLFVQRGNEQSRPLHVGFPFLGVLSLSVAIRNFHWHT